MLSLEGQIRSLKSSWGASHGSLWPAMATLHLGIGDPRDGGVELTSTDSPGYAAQSVTNDGTNFPAPDAEGVLSTPEIGTWTATADWDDAPTHAWLADGADILEVVEQDNPSGEIPLEGGVIYAALDLFYNDTELI